MSEEEKTMSVAEVAKRLGKAEGTILRYRKKGYFPGARQLREKGRPWAIPLADVKAFQRDPWQEEAATNE